MAAKRQLCVADCETAASKRLKEGEFEVFGSFCVLPSPPAPVLSMPFWVANEDGINHGSAAVAGSSDSIHVQAASLRSWGAAKQCSLSFKPSGCSDDDDETEDTATSSCSSASHEGSQDRATASQEDEGDSHPQVLNVQKQQQDPKALSAPAAAFSFGERNCVTPDMTGFEQWDIIETLLALGQS